mgnify:FL=1|jgi:hypothetical protein
MSAWRRRALEAFPSLRAEISAANSTLYSLFFELVPICVAAHKTSDKESLKRIYGFAVWCSRQPERELWNAAGVAFFEKLAQHRNITDQLPDWVPKDVFENVSSLLEDAIGADALDSIRSRYNSSAR